MGKKTALKRKKHKLLQNLAFCICHFATAPVTDKNPSKKQ
jgi:hypothetical protein